MPTSSEIELHLFEFCNLKCNFCGQDHDSKEGTDSIGDKAAPVMEFIKNNLLRSHIINIMGGEIFNDEIPDRLFDDYIDLVLKIHTFAESLGHEILVNWVTNLVYKKYQRVINLLETLEQKGVKNNISTSYDFFGRKTLLWKEELFKQNLENFKTRIYTIGFVLTKPTVDLIFKQDDSYFEYLYQNFPLYFDFYVPEKGARFLMPSDQDLLDVYLFIAKKYPKISPIKDLLIEQQNKMTCYSLNKLTLLPSGKEVKCRYMDYKEDDFKNQINYKSNENIIMSFVEENECLSCKWFERCSFRCFVQADWADRVRLPGCFLKTFFNTIEQEGFENGIDIKTH